MRLVLSAFALFAAFAIYSCNSEQDCPDLTLIGQSNCPEDTNWVCGCNDSTYINECLANRNGAWVKAQGKCPE